MRRLLRGLAIAAAAIAPVMASVPASAASADTLMISGTGTITPGLTATGTPQTFNFSGSGTNQCAATGNDVIGSVAVGQGSITITCTIRAEVVVAACVYVRVDPLVIVGCVDESVAVAIGVCEFVPGQLTPPVTWFTLICGAIYMRVP